MFRFYLVLLVPRIIQNIHYVKAPRGGQGDQYVEVKVEIPTKLSREEKEYYEKLKNSKTSESPFDKFKKAFKK